MKYKYDYVVFICRCQPPHKAHIEIIQRALSLGQYVFVLIGSASQPRTIKNPWTWEERRDMISASVSVSELVLSKLKFIGIEDIYNDQQWATNVQDKVNTLIAQTGGNVTKANVALIGHKKDDSSFYLDMFPQWNFEGIDNIDDMHSTDIRRMMFELEQLDAELIPEQIVAYINAFMNSEVFSNLKQEYEYIEKYKLSWAKAPHPPTFVTVDAVVVQSGHVLLVRRRAQPGKGLWAMPGGFVNPSERLEDAMIRELREETKLKVPEPVLRGNVVASEVFDDPQRSTRGRTITHAYLIELPPGKLPKVKGGDDAEKAKWVPLNVFKQMQDQMFEDHYFIVDHLVNKL